MKKKAGIWLAAILCMIISVTVSADVQNKKTEPDYKTDYYMIVESKAGGIDIYANPDLEAAKLSEEMIPNGTALHIEGEVEDEAHRRTWGYVQYHGMNGFVPLDDCRPAASRQEAIDSELYLAGRDDVDYQADYDITAENGDLKLYQGPGEKYGIVPGASDIKSGEILHITQDAHMNDGSYWGVTTVDGKQGWVNLDEMKNPDKQANPTSEEGADGVKDEKASGSADNSLPAENMKSSDMSFSAGAEKTETEPEADPEISGKSEIASATDLEEPGKPEPASAAASEAPGKSDATNKPVVTSAPKSVSEAPSGKASTTSEKKPESSPAASEKPESTEATGENKKESNKETENSTEKNETAGKNTENRAEEKTQETSGQTVKTSSGIPTPFLWIAAITVGAAVGVLIYHFKKR